MKVRHEEVAGEVVVFLSLYLPLVFQGKSHRSDKQGIEFARRAKKLWDCIKAQLLVDGVAAFIIEDFEKQPDTESAQVIFRHKLTQQLKHDLNFSKQVESILY